MTATTTARKRRGRGEGGLFYDKDRKVWTGVIDLGVIDGKRRRRKVSAATKSEAREKLAALLHEKKRSGVVASGSLTVGQVVAELMSNPPPEWRSAITMDVNGDHARRITQALGTIRVTQLTPAQVEKMLAAMVADGYSTSIIAGTRSVLRRALRRCQRDHGLARNVADLAELPSGSKRVSRSMTTDEARQLLGSDLDAFWKAYCLLALTLGMRPGELAGLTWADIDSGAGLIRIRHSLKRIDGELVLADLKTAGSKRTLTMPESWPGWGALRQLRKKQLADRLAVGEAYQDLDLVFCNEAGGARTRDYIRVHFAQVCQRAGIRTFVPRETRHTYVSVRSDAGEDIESISAAVGHSNSSITKIVYRHVIADAISAAPEAFSKILGGDQEATQ